MILPENVTLRMWAGSLIIDFPEDDIPILIDEKDWKEWGNFLIESTSFIQNNAPSTAIYQDWKEWASAVYFTMNDL